MQLEKLIFKKDVDSILRAFKEVCRSTTQDDQDDEKMFLRNAG